MELLRYPVFASLFKSNSPWQVNIRVAGFHNYPLGRNGPINHNFIFFPGTEPFIS